MFCIKHWTAQHAAWLHEYGAHTWWIFTDSPNFKHSTPLPVLGVRLPVLNLAFECMDVLWVTCSLGILLCLPTPGPRRQVYHPGCSQKGPRSCGRGRCDCEASITPAGPKKEQQSVWDTQWNSQVSVLSPWPTLLVLAQLFCLSKLHSKSRPKMRLSHL